MRYNVLTHGKQWPLGPGSRVQLQAAREEWLRKKRERGQQPTARATLEYTLVRRRKPCKKMK
jgi:hypothetical protein